MLQNKELGSAFPIAGSLRLVPGRWNSLFCGVFLTRTLKQKSSSEIRHVLGVVIWKVQYGIIGGTQGVLYYRQKYDIYFKTTSMGPSKISECFLFLNVGPPSKSLAVELLLPASGLVAYVDLPGKKYFPLFLAERPKLQGSDEYSSRCGRILHC